MLRSIALILVVSVLAFADEAEEVAKKDGPCPKIPSTKKDMPVADVKGNWYVAKTTCETHAKERQCNEIHIDTDGDDYVTKHHWRCSSSGTEHEEEHKFESIDDDHKHWKAFDKKADGSWEENGWKFTLVDIHGDAVLEHACKEEGDKHLEYYRVLSKSLPSSTEAREVFIETYKSVVDEHLPKVYEYNHENCDYKYD